MKDWPIPTTAKEFHSFLGLASYYRKFIPHFAKWANLLHNLIHPITMKKKHAGIKIPPLAPNLPLFKWTAEHQGSFNKLKDICSCVSLLRLYKIIYP